MAAVYNTIFLKNHFVTATSRLYKIVASPYSTYTACNTRIIIAAHNRICVPVVEIK